MELTQPREERRIGYRGTEDGGLRLPRTRSPHPQGFAEETVRLARSGDEPISRIACELGVLVKKLAQTVKQAQLDESGCEGLITGKRANSFSGYEGLVDELYLWAEKIRLVLDELNTHTEAAVDETFDPKQAWRILGGLEFHPTPNHRWMAKPGGDRAFRAYAPASLYWPHGDRHAQAVDRAMEA